MEKALRSDSNGTSSLFQRPLWVCLLAFTAAFAWGWAYPLIKLGFAQYEITEEMTGAKMLFAGIRFTLSGVIILAIAARKGITLRPKENRNWWFILLFSLINTTIHNTCFYIGLSHAQGARSAILNSLSTFLVVILSCMIFRSDRMSLRKVVGCMLGFSGILLLNLKEGGIDMTSFTMLGDGLIMLNALCGACASLLTRPLARRIDVFSGTGYSLLLGGVLLILPGLLLGGTLPHINLTGVVILILLIAISTIGFTLYNKLLTVNPVGKVAIWNSLIPVVGAITSCICLGEAFHLSYLMAAVLSASGIAIINFGKR